MILDYKDAQGNNINTEHIYCDRIEGIYDIEIVKHNGKWYSKPEALGMRPLQKTSRFLYRYRPIIINVYDI